MNTLELAAHVKQILLKSPKMKFLEHTIDSTDSTETLGWNTKGSISSDKVEARLLVWKVLDQRRFGIVSLGTHIPGWFHGMANDASRLTFPTVHLLLAHFNTHHPQATWWRFFPLTLELAAALTTMLSGAQCAPESLLGTPP